MNLKGDVRGAILFAVVFVSLFLSFAINYGLAIYGEPRALWIMRDVIGIIK